MASILSTIAAPRRTNRQSLMAATFFALQVTVLALVLNAVYDVGRSHGANWAIISAILVLYPGVQQSFSAAMVRIAANVLGATIGFLVGRFLGTDFMQVILALVVVIFAGELLHMDLALRTACVAVIIVMNTNDQTIRVSAIERIVAVFVGCGAAMLMHVIAQPISRRLSFFAQTGTASISPDASSGAG